MSPVKSERRTFHSECHLDYFGQFPINQGDCMSSDLVSRPPKFGGIPNWLGTEMAARILSFAQNSRDQFVPSDIGYGESNRIDLALRRSSKLKHLGELERELQERVREALPLIFDQLGYTPFDPAW